MKKAFTISALLLLSVLCVPLLLAPSGGGGGSSGKGNTVTNQLDVRIPGPWRLTVLGDSKSIFTPTLGVSNQWPMIFTNMPWVKSNMSSFNNLAHSGDTIIEITNQWHTAISTLASPTSGTNNLIVIRVGANDFPTNSSVPFWINIYSNMLVDISSRTNCYSCVFDIQPRTDWPDTLVPTRDALNQALRRITNWNFFVKSEKLVPDAANTTFFQDGIHENTNGSIAVASAVEYAIRSGPVHFYDDPKSQYEAQANIGMQPTVLSIAAWSFNTTYKNTNSLPITASFNYQLASAAVSGVVSFSSYVNGALVKTRGANTSTGIPANPANYGDMIISIPAFGNYALTNSSTGAGNSVTLFGGQLTILGKNN